MKKRWLYKPIPSGSEIESLSRALNLNRYLSAILLQRGIFDFESARKFFRPNADDLHDPFLMADMGNAVERLHEAIVGHEHILIYGDYDVDGTTAVALVYRALRRLGAPCAVYIPDRHTEGYGISRKGIEYASSNGYTLIIALDCGIRSADMVLFAEHKGIEFIICDHHLPGERIPNARAVLDPKRTDCGYPYKELSGCGLGFKLLQAYFRRYGDESILFEYIDLVAVSIASDIVPITGENRVLTYLGLRKLNENPVPGLKALKEVAGLERELDVGTLVFTLGPRINAAGRVALAHASVELMIADSEEEARKIADGIEAKNEERRRYDADITEEALAMIENDEGRRSAKSTVLYKEDWHKGVIGIVASRCIERYYRPTIILTSSNNPDGSHRITGSARSIHGFDLHEAITHCSDLLEKFGGHQYAAGLTLHPGNLPAFQQRFEEVVAASVTDEMLTPVEEIDVRISFDAIGARFVRVLKQMGPFGPGNSNPVFAADHVSAVNSLSCYKEKHIRFLGSQEGNQSVFQVVGFGKAEHYDRLAAGDSFSMAFTIEENTFNGKTSIQLIIRDLCFE